MTKAENLEVHEILKECIGENLYHKVISRMAGYTVRIPRYGLSDKKVRNKYIRYDYENDYTIEDLMKVYGLSKSQIYKILEAKD